MKLIKELTVSLGERSYPIWIGQGLLSELSKYLHQLNISNRQKVLIITDDQVGPLYAERILSQLTSAGFNPFVYTIPAGEKSKSFLEYENILSFAIQNKLDRKSLIFALGGGVVGDLAGFVASTYMRGIPFIQLPTTVLAHDSSVGGKVAINHPFGKNMIGSFYQPLAVIYDTATLKTLPEREVLSGFAEVLKAAFIWDSSFVEWLEQHRVQCLRLEEPYLSEALFRAIQVKTQVVAQDEREESLRAILNFGHTFGHAFEALGEYTRLTHGEAISIGMVLAAKLSELVFQQNNLACTVTRLLSEYRLPTDWTALPWDKEQVLEKMYVDKKVVGNSLNLILLKELGRAEVVQNVDPDLISEILGKGERTH